MNYRITAVAFAAIALSLSLATTVSANDFDKKQDIELEAAIRALYGEGLSIQVDKSAKTITLDWDKSKMTPKRLQGFIEKFYLAKIKHSPNHFGDGIPDAQFEGTAATAKLRGIRGHKLLEPYTKMDLCKLLAAELSTREKVKKMEVFCAEQGIRTVNHPVFAFRGKRVVYSIDKPYDGLELDEELFTGSEGKRAIAVTVSVNRPLNTHRSLRAVWPVTVNALPHHASQDAKTRAQTIGRQAKALIKKLQAKALKHDDKLAGKRGNIVFAGQSFTGFDLVEPLPKNAKPSCKSAYVYVFGPRKRTKKAAYQVVFKANGNECIANVEHGGFTKLYLAHTTCKRHLQAGTNKVEVRLAKNVNKKLGTRWDKNKLRKVPYYSNTAGKTIVKKKISCTLD